MKRIGKLFRSSAGILSIVMAIALMNGGAALANSAPTVKKEFPRLGGIQIGKTPFADGYADPAYQSQLARLDLVLLGGSGYGATLNELAAAIKTKNRQMVIGKYTNIAETFTNSSNEINVRYRDKLDSEKGPNTTNAHDWWLRDVDGNRIEIWPGTYRTNLTEWVKPDRNGDRWPEWRAKRDYEVWFNDDVWDFWYSDLVSWKPKFRSQGLIGDYSGGKVTNESEIHAAYRRGHVANWNEIRRLTPNKLISGNHNWYLFDDPNNRLDLKEYKNQLNGGILERVMGIDHLEFNKGWSTLYTYYGWTMEYFVDPKIVIFNVEGEVDDYQFFRYAFATCLMNDAFFDYSPANEYIFGTVEWFDEFDLAGRADTNWLGLSVSDPPTRAWQKGVYRRDFENGIALVNPRGNGTVTITVEDGFRRIDGQQDPFVNNGKPASRITLQDADGIVLIRENPATPKPKKRPKAPVMRN